MFDLTILDYIYVGVIILSTVWATVRGGVYETISTLAWVVAAVAARFVSPWLDGLLQSWFKLSESTVGTLVASYFIVFFVILLLTGIVNSKLRDRIQRSVLNVTDKTLGVIFGIIRGIVLMGGLYWLSLWYYSDTPQLPSWVENARTRPIMQMTAVKIDQWFVPGAENKLLQRDVAGSKEAIEIYNNLINPAIQNKQESESTQEGDTGYKSSERTALENQLLQIETVANVIEERESAEETNKE
ncbi:MAG: CvpA family protein [Proteobacteria bacterium]|nr:CvpA family protein [Candidatus Enterousia scatequi]